MQIYQMFSYKEPEYQDTFMKPFRNKLVVFNFTKVSDSVEIFICCLTWVLNFKMIIVINKKKGDV